MWIFFIVPFALLAIAALLGWLAPSALIVAYVLILAALAIALVSMTWVVVLQAYRLLSGRRRIIETAVGQVRAMHWTMVLLSPQRFGTPARDAPRLTSNVVALPPQRRATARCPRVGRLGRIGTAAGAATGPQLGRDGRYTSAPNQPNPAHVFGTASPELAHVFWHSWPYLAGHGRLWSDLDSRRFR